nr:hypothetical protein [Tanacetum cinerariifolium]
MKGGVVAPRKGKSPRNCLLCKSTTTRNEDMPHPNRKMIQALIHTARSLRTTFRKHKVTVVTIRPMEKILKLSGRDGRLAKLAAEIRTYDIMYIQRKEARGSLVNKFFEQGEQVQKTPDANEGKFPT